MSRYIDADALIEDFRHCGADEGLIDAIAHRVSLAPTADAVEVVRCRDCKHRYEPTRCALWYGTADGKEYFLERGENFYCPWGERSEK